MSVGIFVIILGEWSLSLNNFNFAFKKSTGGKIHRPKKEKEDPQTLLHYQLLAVKRVPPAGITLQVFSKPGHDGVLPFHLLVEVCDDMIFTFNSDKLNVAAKNLQGVEELDALADRNVGVDSAVEKKKRGLDLVGIEE